MRYLKFRVENFRGIKDTTITFNPEGISHIYTLVGLNESGKTTILEAIHRISPDTSNRTLMAPVYNSNDDNAIIPKHLISNFTGSVIVSAQVKIESKDVEELTRFMHEDCSIVIDPASIPSKIWVEHHNVFQSSNFVELKNIWSLSLSGRAKTRRRMRELPDDDTAKAAQFLNGRLPVIAYYPTFVFDFPQRIYLSGKDSDKKNTFYKNVFQDILDAQGEGLNIENHIVDRVRGSDQPKNPMEFLATLLGGGSNIKEQIDAVMYKASATVTKAVFGKWNEIFRERISPKEVLIEWRPEIDNSGLRNVYIQFFIKDGVNRFPIPDRSLGFRWFFCFLLFTQFRASRKQTRGTLFLFDEPASNLHSRAQEQLLRSFPNIASGDNSLIYSTHSHYMISPTWLENTYIIENRAINYEGVVGEFSSDQIITEVTATPYRRFVGENPDKSTYFQPILDKLEFKPSLLEAAGEAIIVEGKSDFYVLAYFARFILNVELRIYPSSGANDLTPMISLFLGWGWKFTILLDGDHAGQEAKQKIIDEFGLSDKLILTITDILGDSAVRTIEHLLSDQDKSLVSAHFRIESRPSKKHILRFFAELLASEQRVKFSSEMTERVEKLLHRLAMPIDDKAEKQ